MYERADVIMLMIIIVVVFIYPQRWKKGRQRLNECSVGRCRERDMSQEESTEDGGLVVVVVNSPLCGGEKRESLLWYVYMSA